MDNELLMGDLFKKNKGGGGVEPKRHERKMCVIYSWTQRYCLTASYTQPFTQSVQIFSPHKFWISIENKLNSFLCKSAILMCNS